MQKLYFFAIGDIIPYLQGAHGQRGDRLTLGHHGVHGLKGVLQAAVGDVRLT